MGSKGYNLFSQSMSKNYVHQRPLWCSEKKCSFLGPRIDVLLYTVGVSSRNVHISEVSSGDFYKVRALPE